MAGALRYLIKRGDGYWARRIVPKNLRPIIGKTELRTPLGSIRQVAERHYHAALAAIQDHLDAARVKLDASAMIPLAVQPRARPLTVAQIAHTHYAEELALDESVRNLTDRNGLMDTAWSRRARIDLMRRVASGHATNNETEAAIGWAVAKFQARGSSTVEAGTAEWRSLARILAQIQLEVEGAAVTRDTGREPSPPTLPILAEPPSASVVTLRPRGSVVPLLDLLDGYLRTLRAQGKGAEAERRWRPTFKAFVRHLGHDDARHLTKADVAGWRDHLLEVEKLAPKTVRDVHLASLRAVLGWAADNDRLPENPAARVRIDVAKAPRSREKGFTTAEALAVLHAASSYQPPTSRSPATRESIHVTAAKRWLPWLCALTGARVAEMAQLRVQDVQTRDGITFLRITPDAGSVKSGHYRDVPVHSQLIERGFIEFVRQATDGPLFYDASKQRSGVQHPSKIVANRVSAWVRALAVIPAQIDPSHGWRHRFKTVGRELEISDRVLDAIQGHAGRTAGDDYGDVTLKTRNAAVQKLPAYSVD